jgi:DNA-binding MarR family transcriptional regulator
MFISASRRLLASEIPLDRRTLALSIVLRYGRAMDEPRYTEKQGQYLAFIYAYTKLNRRPPAEADFQHYFSVTPPSVHNMVLTLERLGLISREPGQPRSIRLLLEASELPILE